MLGAAGVRVKPKPRICRSLFCILPAPGAGSVAARRLGGHHAMNLHVEVPDGTRIRTLATGTGPETRDPDTPGPLGTFSDFIGPCPPLDDLERRPEASDGQGTRRSPPVLAEWVEPAGKWIRMRPGPVRHPR